MSLLKALPAAALLFLPSSATVQSLSVIPSSGKTEVVIGVNAAVEVQDFTLDAPVRVVVDLKGATLDMAYRRYDKESRGGITNIRYSQYRPNIVRIVIEMDAKHPYDVTRTDGEIRVSVSGGKTTDYTAWSPTPGRKPAYVATRTPTPARMASANTETKAAAAHSTPVPATPVKRVAVAAKPLSQPTQAVAQVETSSAQDDPAPAAAEIAPRPGTTYDRPNLGSTYDKPIALFSQAQQSQQPPITVTFQDTDIRDVIASFAAFSGRTIVVGKDVTGTITAEVKNQPWDVALRAILQGQGLAASEDPVSGIITVDSYANILNRQASEPLQTQLVSINYARASNLVPTVQQLLQKDCPQIPTSNNVPQANSRQGCVARGLVAADSTTNTLIITETASRLADVLQYVHNLDVRTPQVGIKAKIIFVNRTNIEDIGLSYDLGTGTDQFFSQLVKRPDPATLKPIDTNGDGVPDALGGGTPFNGDRILLGGNALSAIANANARVVNPALSVVFSTALGKFQLTSFLDALQEVRLADLQAEPSIVTLDNRQASIQVGQEVPIRVLDANTANLSGATTPNAQPRATVQMKQVGIILTVTPHITNNRQILLLLHAENSDAQIASSDVGFVFNKQSGDTQLLVGDGETAVIGGLTVTQATQSKSGIPLLVDLPLIGRLFGETRTDEEKRDLLILVTPHIIDDGAPIPSSSNPIPPATR
ncbi:MAG TPA: AMIN domain-containing protein [Gemmatimonadaceae bacterium]|jgi:type IV pilus assembly protein PilQ|nr:AMIN domain-containing protein [Gemmatimonadaceae bacterium]